MIYSYRMVDVEQEPKVSPLLTPYPFPGISLSSYCTHKHGKSRFPGTVEDVFIANLKG